MSNTINPLRENRFFAFLSYALLFFSLLSTSTKAAANATCSWPVVHHDSRLTARADCVGPQTDNIRWIYNFDLEDGVYVQALVIGHDGTIYCYSNPTATAYATLYAISMGGTLKWSYTIEDTVGIYKEYIIDIAIGNDNTVYLSGYWQFVYAIKESNLRWKYDHLTNDQGFGGLINIGPDGTIYIGGTRFSGNNKLVALNTDGSLKWRFETFQPYTRPAVDLDGTVYVARSGTFLGGGGYYAYLAAINPDGSTKWIYQCLTPEEGCSYFGGRLPQYITVGEDERLYVGSYSGSSCGIGYHTIGLYDTKDGRLVSSNCGVGYSCGGSRPALSPSGSVYLSNSANTVVKVDVNNDCNRTELYSSQASAPLPPILDNADNVYFTTDDGKIICLSSTGETKWVVETNAPLAPWYSENYAIANGILYYVSGDGKLYAIGQPASTQYGINTNSGYIAEPVNTALGNYVYQHTDLTVPGRGMGLQFERGYNSQDTYSGPLGYGWTHSYNIRLTENGAVVIKWGDGHEDFYNANNNGTYSPLYGGVFDTLVKNADNSYSLTRKDQTKYSFDTSGKLINIIDKNNNSITLTYNGSGNLTTISDTTAGRNITVTYDTNNHITQITDPIGRTVHYAYNGNGDLISVTNANGGVTKFTYDANHHILTITNPRGNSLVSNTGDTKGRVISQTNGKGNTTTFAYDTPNSGDTTITDPLGFTTIHTHDSAYRLVQTKDANGNTINDTYDNNNNRTGVTDKKGSVTSYTYDAMGNVTSKTDPLNNVTTIVYDARNNPTKKTDAMGNITTYEYDTNGNLTSTTDPLGNISLITYNSYGQPLTLTDANGNVTTNGYDAQGNLITVTDALNNKTTYAYDSVGRRISATDAHGNTTSFTYDKNDNLLTVTDPLGGVTSYAYDTNNNRTSVTDPNRNVTSYSYDENDLLATVKDALNNVVSYAYDKADNKISVQDALGNTTFYAYDGVKNLVQMKDALNNITTSIYDANGNKLTETNPLGHTVTYTYDALNKVVSVTDPLGNTTTNTYDALGRITNTTNAKGQITIHEYDAMSRLTKVTDSDGGTVLYVYDKNGNRISMAEPKGNITSYTYDAVNRLIQKVEPLGSTYQYTYDAVGNRASLTDAKGETIKYTYDGNNRLTTITYPNTSTVTFTYDANGNKTRMVDNLGTTIYTYDALSRMVSCKDTLGKIVGYSYDANGNRTSITYPDGKKVVTYTYDVLNRLKTVTDWLTNTTNYTYDKAGNLAGILNPNNTTATYTYDAAGRLTGLNNTKSDSTVICSYSYTLDAIGNHTKVVLDEPLTPLLAYQDITYTCDAENRLTNVGSTANTYDANGNLTKRGSDTFIYDYEDRLIWSNIGGTITKYRYDGMGNRLAKVGRRKTTRYVLDINGSLSNLLAETDGSNNITAYYVHGLGLISKVLPDGTAYYYHYDSRGSTVALTNSGENIKDKYAYDPFGNLAKSTGSTRNPFKYVGRYGVMDEGNELSYIRARYYIPELGRFITKDLLTGNDRDGQSLNRYVYAMNNPVRFVDITGLSISEGRVQDNFDSSDTIEFHKMLLDEYEYPWWYKYTDWAEPAESILRVGGAATVGIPLDPYSKTFLRGTTIGFLIADTLWDRDKITNLRKPIQIETIEPWQLGTLGVIEPNLDEKTRKILRVIGERELEIFFSFLSPLEVMLINPQQTIIINGKGSEHKL